MPSQQQPTVAYIGAGITPQPAAADKTFMLQITPRLRERGITVKIVSITETPPGELPRDMLFVPRVAHRHSLRRYAFDGDGRIVGYHHQHAVWRQTLELSATLIARRRLISRFTGTGPNVIFGWMDLTTVLPVLSRFLVGNSHLVAGVPQLVPKTPHSDRLRAHALSAADAAIVGTHATAEGLRADGCTCDQIMVAPWGSEGVPHDSVRFDAPQALHLIWTGYVRQIGHADFVAAVAIAREVVAARPDIEFTFCLKPQIFSPHHASHSSERIHVIRGGADFVSSLGQYSALFSPVLQSRSTMAPPLSWIDAFSAALPIITTRTAGIDEIISSGQNGFVADDGPELTRFLCSTDLQARLGAMRRPSRELFERRYSIDVVADEYASMYRGIIDHARKRRGTR